MSVCGGNALYVCDIFLWLFLIASSLFSVAADDTKIVGVRKSQQSGSRRWINQTRIHIESKTHPIRQKSKQIILYSESLRKKISQIFIQSNKILFVEFPGLSYHLLNIWIDFLFVLTYINYSGKSVCLSFIDSLIDWCRAANFSMYL